jgi:hypothetical protein
MAYNRKQISPERNAIRMLVAAQPLLMSANADEQQEGNKLIRWARAIIRKSNEFVLCSPNPATAPIGSIVVSRADTGRSPKAAAAFRKERPAPVFNYTRPSGVDVTAWADMTSLNIALNAPRFDAPWHSKGKKKAENTIVPMGFTITKCAPFEKDIKCLPKPNVLSAKYTRL